MSLPPRFISQALLRSVTDLKGVGPKMAEKLQRLNILTIQDVLFHLPLRYQDRTRVCPIGALRDRMETVIEGQVEHTEVVLNRRRMMLCRVSDGSGSLLLRFFHFNEQQRKALSQGVQLRCFGEARRGFDVMEMVHPEYRLQSAGAVHDVEENLTPVYATTEGVHQLTLRKLIDEALPYVAHVQEWLDESLLGHMTVTRLADAVRFLHRPPPDTDTQLLLEGTHPVQQRLAFEELLAHQLSLLQLRRAARLHSAPEFSVPGVSSQQFLSTLPFSLTGAQQRVLSEIQADQCRPHPMMRLVQGDVGSGKTVVAALACLQAAESGYQAAVMAPTEILAEQHLQNFSRWFGPLGITVAWLSGKQKAAQRREMRALLESGEAAVAVGTHALFQDDIQFHRLGLVVVDEQHRFGVHQRLALRQKGEGDGRYPHQMIMTATPIPRTLAQTAYADLDLSVIDELPPGRKPVKTVAMNNVRRADVVARVAKACRTGQQCYWVCTLVETSEVLQCEAAEITQVSLQEALPDLKVGLVHGRLKPDEKIAVMQAFKAGEIQLLVATTVIEVGVDVPNATLMVIENSERLGLSQLHQLRGRVGRGDRQSSCVLLYQQPLSQTGRKRIDAMRQTHDGFLIAQIDLELRGPGELLGTRQTGLAQLKVADLNRDAALIPRATAAAAAVIENFPEAVAPLMQRWVGDNAQYREV